MMNEERSNAPGAPGIAAKWTSSSKSGIGKALNTASEVSFTLSHGILNEVYFPREDIACIRDMELLVTNGTDFFSEEKRDTTHLIKMIHNGVPAYKIINTCLQKKYQVTKEIVADPFRNTILQKISFKSDRKESYHLYALLSPHLNNQGNHNSGWVGEYKGIPMLFAEGNGLSLAMACSSKWLKRSVGYVSASDGWTDLQQHKKMKWEYSNADNGNIALTGEIDISVTGDFVLALAFGRNPAEAANHAWSSLLDGFDEAKKNYVDGWKNWLQLLHNVKGKNYKISAAVLRIHEAKTFPGGILASLSIPWGESKGDQDRGGYHLVWPRDLVESADCFFALKTKGDALRIVNYLMSVQKTDGSWSQNMWLEGTAYWKGSQMDQTALPILLIDKCNRHSALEPNRMKRYWPIIKKAIAYILLNGPYTMQDRWEEENGLSPFTIAAEIAGLLAGADLADINNEKELAAYCRETADYWNDHIEEWTYVTNTSLAKKTDVDGYYIRINPYHNIAASALGNRCIDLKNHFNGNGTTQINELISVDALALVRFGLRAANDEKILNTIKVIDTILKVQTPNGPCWYRYNNDGYGEDEQGNPYTGAGKGRLWPLLTGERAHYEIAAGNIKGAKNLLSTMDAFANNGLLSEQIWDTNDIPDKELFFGNHSGSAMPLTWAHAEYIKLCASIRDKEIFDMPSQTRERYLKKKKKSPHTIWRFNNQCSAIHPAKTLRIELKNEALVCWTDDNWQTIKQVTTNDTGIGIFVADLPVEKEQVGQIEFTFFWKEANKWEDKNFSVKRIDNQIHRTVAV
ncbi:MAG: glycoside hydrolase family 15 protein [Chitinophagaceae bacterium]